MSAALWLVTAVSLAATILNVHRVRMCFVLWIGTNATWATVDYAAGIHAQAALHLVYLGLAVYGLIRWRGSGIESPEALTR